MDNYKLACLLFGHKWGPEHEVGCTGEIDNDCMRCGCSWGNCATSDNGRMLRRPLWTGLRRKWWHRLMCKLGRHVWHDWGCGAPTTCVWCWKEAAK